MSTKIFPTILMGLMICSAIVYIPSSNWRMIVYWLEAGIINFVVTY
jgi:hypothetical protein